MEMKLVSMSYSGNEYDSDNYTENSEASTENPHLDDCNLEDIPRQRAYFMMPPFESPAHMRALDLELMFTPEFLDHLFLNSYRCGGGMTDGELYVGMQFKTKDDAIM